MPRPWINRTSPKPRAWAASRYSATTDATSRGAKAWRSSASSIGIRTGSSSGLTRARARTLVLGSELRTARHVLLPVPEAQEILPRELALSEGRRPLEEGHVDHRDPLGPRRLGD